MKKLLSFTLGVITIALLFSGCTLRLKAEDISNTLEKHDLAPIAVIPDKDIAAAANFYIELFKSSYEENVLLSPLSIINALAITSNGAAGDTLKEFEQVFGTDIASLNEMLKAYNETLPHGKGYEVQVANSIWFKDDESLSVEKGFLQDNADYYNSGIYRAAFDETTLKDINNLVKDKTEGRITDILDKIPKDAVLYLVNALAFDGEWNEVYEKSNIANGNFVTEGLEKQAVDFMYSKEKGYIKGDNEEGFIKYYKDNKYAFVGLLPSVGITMEEYISTLTGEEILSLLENKDEENVQVGIPKFKSEASLELSYVLPSLGLNEAFDEHEADFSTMATSTKGNIYINRVLHKTFIEVNAKGTKAGAATVVEMKTEGAMIIEKEVILNRPFLYMIVDTEYNLPIFIGTMNSLK